MYSTFSKNIFGKLLKNGFKVMDLKTVDITNDTKIISFLKPVGDVLYTVTLVNCNMLSMEQFLLKSKKAEKNILKTYKHFNKFVSVNILVNNNCEEIKNFVENNSPSFDDDFYNVYWSVCYDTTLSLYVPKNQPSNILKLKDIVLECTKKTKPIKKNLLELTLTEMLDNPLPPKFKFIRLSYILGLIFVFIYIALYFYDTTLNTTSFLHFGALSYVRVFSYNEYYRIVTSIFLHFTLSHLIFNTVSLIIFGTRIEAYFGKIHFFLVFILSGIVGNVVTLLLTFFSFNDSYTTIYAGASGGIYGLLGMCLVTSKFFDKSLLGIDFSTFLFLTIFNFGISFTLPNIGITAHTFGFLTGVLLGYFLCLNFKNQHRLIKKHYNK